MDVKHCCKDINLGSAANYAGGIDADIVIFPEVFSTGFCYEKIGALAESYPFATLEMLKPLSWKCCSVMIGSIITTGPKGRCLNMGFVLDRGKLAGTYDKVHPFGIEKNHFAAGNKIEPIKTSLGQIGVMICYDIRFPEVARKLALLGADILVTVAQFPAVRQDHWNTLVRARAIENQIPHLACNRTGSDDRNEFAGGSMIIDGWGRVLAEAGSEESVITADLDIKTNAQIRKEIPCFSDRQEALY